MKKVESHTVPDQIQETRLSDYVVGIFKSRPSKKGMKKAIMKGHVKVNGKTGVTGDYLRGGEHIELFEAKPPSQSSQLFLKLQVLYEDDHLAIINKPAGIIVSGNKRRTVENALLSNLKSSSHIDKLPKPEPAHRLDGPTSGALLVGKTRTCITALNKLFEERKIEKTYYAIAIGKMEGRGQMDDDIKGKKALTKYEVISSLESTKYGGLNLVRLIPSTGRKHQLRIHLSAIGNPILGDKEYGIKGKISRGSGLYLHASSLEFEHPFEKKKISVSIELPSKFEKIFPKVK